MIDRIIGYNSGDPIYLSDVNPYTTYMGYEDKYGVVHMY